MFGVNEWGSIGISLARGAMSGDSWVGVTRLGCSVAPTKIGASAVVKPCQSQIVGFGATAG